MSPVPYVGGPRRVGAREALLRAARIIGRTGQRNPPGTPDVFEVSAPRVVVAPCGHALAVVRFRFLPSGEEPLEGEVEFDPWGDAGAERAGDA